MSTDGWLVGGKQWQRYYDARYPFAANAGLQDSGRHRAVILLPVT